MRGAPNAEGQRSMVRRSTEGRCMRMSGQLVGLARLETWSPCTSGQLTGTAAAWGLQVRRLHPRHEWLRAGQAGEASRPGG